MAWKFSIRRRISLVVAQGARCALATAIVFASAMFTMRATTANNAIRDPGSSYRQLPLSTVDTDYVHRALQLETGLHRADRLSSWIRGSRIPMRTRS